MQPSCMEELRDVGPVEQASSAYGCGGLLKERFREQISTALGISVRKLRRE